MMKKKAYWPIVMLLILLLAACAPTSATPTPTIVPLNRSGQGLNQPEQATVTPTPTATRPTATPIPFPSPTPTATPLAFLLTPDPMPTATAAPAGPQAEITSAGLNIRQGPGVSYSVVGTAAAGDRFGITGTDASRAWLQVRLPDGGTGWISGRPDYSRVVGSLDGVPVVSSPPVQPAALAQSGQTVPVRGGRLVFATGSGGDLYVVDADGSNLRRLASGVIDPAVSPDGRQVAFTRWDGAEMGTLYTINLDGSDERAVIGDSRQAKSPAWSPDGQELIFSFQHGGLRDPEPECRNFDYDDGVRIPDNATVLKSHFNAQSGVLTICFIRKEDLQWSLRRVNVQTGDFADLPVDLYSYNPAWDPRQPWRVVYDGDKGLMQLDVKQGRQWPLTTDLRDTGPVFSPDGQKLALTYKQHDHWEVYTLDLETGSRARLTKPPILANPQYNSAAPAWSPDGTQLAFVTDRTGRWEIWVMNADGTGQRPFLPPAVQEQLTLEYRGVNEQLLNWIQ